MIGSHVSRGLALGVVALVVGGLALGTGVGRGQSGTGLESDIRSGREELNRLSEEIRESEARIAELKGQEKEAAKALATLEETLAKAIELRDAYARQVGRLRQNIEERNQELEDSREGVDELRKRAAEHVDRIYRRGKPAYVEILLGAEDFGATLRRVQYVGTVLAAERELMERYREERDRLERDLEALRATESELEGLRAGQIREAQKLERMQTEREEMRERTRGEREAFEASLQAMRKSATDLEALIEKLEKTRATAPPPSRSPAAPGEPRTAFQSSESLEKRKGKLSWPVQGKLISKFGRARHPKYGTSTFNSGIDIRAPEGRTIKSIARGQVEFVDWVTGYGKTVIVSHGDGYYSLYAHASRVLVAPGDRVEEGTAIAEVGATESLLGACVHFELRQGGQAINPLPWLKKR